MQRLVASVVVLCALADVAALQAQIVGGPIIPFSGRGAFIPGGTFYGPGVRGRFLLGYGPRALFPTVVLPPVALAGAGLSGPALFAVPAASIQIVIPPPSGNFDNPPAAPANDNNFLPPGAKADDLVVIRPRRELPALPPPDGNPPANRGVPAPMAPMAPPAPFAPRRGFPFDPFADRKMMNVDAADPDPSKEVERLVKRGKEAFEAGEYGAAGEQFARAMVVAPRNATPVFLKAQAAFAGGRYSDAVGAIQAGLALDRAWPASAFDPKELYGTNPARFAEHLAALRAVVAANPGEATLEFLLGYELWFIGEKVEAKKWFDLAEKRLPDPGPVRLFR